jgi:hypothetical protein
MPGSSNQAQRTHCMNTISCPRAMSLLYIWTAMLFEERYKNDRGTQRHPSAKYLSHAITPHQLGLNLPRKRTSHPISLIKVPKASCSKCHSHPTSSTKPSPKLSVTHRLSSQRPASASPSHRQRLALGVQIRIMTTLHTIPHSRSRVSWPRGCATALGPTYQWYQR